MDTKDFNAIYNDYRQQAQDQAITEANLNTIAKQQRTNYCRSKKQ